MLISFITEVILPARAAYKEQLKSVEKFAQAPLLKDLREEARKRKLLNLFLPQVSGLSTLEYAPLAEMLGPLPLANAAMNCSAPDTYAKMAVGALALQHLTCCIFFARAIILFQRKHGGP